MDKTFLFKFLGAYRALTILKDVFFFTRKYFRERRLEELRGRLQELGGRLQELRERIQELREEPLFEDFSEKADDFCEIGFTFQNKGIIYKKISEKKWSAEISIPDDHKFEIGCELAVENYIYKKTGEKAWTIERLD